MTLFQRFTGFLRGSASAAPDLRADVATMARDVDAEVMTREADGGDLVKKSNGAWQQLFGTGETSGVSLADPYRLSPWVGAAIKHIARPIAGVDLKFSNPVSSVEIEDAAMADFWSAPAKGLGRDRSTGLPKRISRFDFIEGTVGWLSLKGVYFWILDDTWMNPRTKVKSPIIIARPDDMRPIWDGGELIGWRWQTRYHTLDLIPEMVVTSCFWSPDDDINGAAPMDAARQATDADYAAGRFWKSLAEANGDLGGSVIAPNGITDEQQQQVIRAMRAKRDAARKGKILPMFLVGDLKQEEATIKAPDAAAVTQRLQSRHEIFIAFGVPPSFAEVTDSYSIGSASDRYKLIEETCVPIAKKMAEGIEQVEFMRTGVKVTAEFNFDGHSTMQQVRAEKYEAARKMHERGVPWSVISDLLDLDMPAFPGSDVAWLPFNLQAVESKAPVMPAPVPAEAPSPGAKAFEELEVLLRGCPVHQGEARGEKPEARADDAKKTKRWEKLMATRAPYVKRIRVTVDRALFEARKETLANIAKAEAEEKMIRSGAFDFIFDIGRFLELLIEPIFKIDATAYEAAANEVIADDLGLTDPFIAPDPNGIAWLQDRKNYIKDAGTEVWEEIRNSLEEGISGGESYQKLAARVRDNFNNISKERAMRIAVTETSIAFESGRHDGMIQAGAEWKEWLTSQDDRVRLSHSALDGKRVPMDEPFSVGGVSMMYPCDPAGTAAEIINCRCVHGPVSGPDGDIVGNDPNQGIPF